MKHEVDVAHSDPAGAKVTDPVCGMAFIQADAAGRLEFDGQTYFFCSQHCLERFQADPSRFVGSRDDSHGVKETLDRDEKKTASAAQTGIEYTCPMHPEIVRSEPGACPICGMALEPREGMGEEVNPELADMTRRFWTSMALTVPILMFMISELIPGDPLLHAIGMRASQSVQFALATPVVLWGGWPFFQRAAASIRNRSLNMFTLIGLGTGSAYFYSVFTLLFPGAIPASFRDMSGQIAVYFEPAAVITTLVLLGQVLD